MSCVRFAVIVGASIIASLDAAAQDATNQDICTRFEYVWSAPERASWTDICRKGKAHLSKAASGGELQQLPLAERDKIVLGSAFIKTMLTKNPYRDQVRTRGLVIKGAIVKDPLRLNDLLIESALSFVNCEFTDVVDLRRSHFSLSVSLTGSFLAGGLDAAESVLDGSLALGGTDEEHPAKPPPAARVQFIHLRGSRIAGDLNIRDTDVVATVDLTAVRTGGSVNIMRLKAHETVLAISDIHGQLAIVWSTLEPTAEIKKKAPKYPLLNLNYVHVAQDVFLNGLIAHDQIDLQGAEIGGGLSLLEGEFGSMTARGATVKGAMSVGRIQPPPGQAGPTKDWTSDATLDLTNASIGTITTRVSMDGWPPTLALTNAKIGGFDFSLSDEREQTEMKASDWFKKWLRRQPAIQPYNHVRTVLFAAGDDTTAAEVGYAGRDRELIKSLGDWDLLNALYLILSKILIGYGYWMWLPLVWTAAFLAVGTVVFKCSKEGKRQRKMRFDAFVYSVDMFLPVIEFRKRHREIDMTSNARFYFYVHKLAGWVISSFIVAGLAGFTK